MKELCKNIYKTSRKNAGLEQIDAARALGVCERSLQSYEASINGTIPPMDVVRNMVILYNDVDLAYQHIKKTPLGEFFPDYSFERSLATASLMALDDFYKVEQKIAGIINITKDGMIDSTERDDWREICESIKDLIHSLNSLIGKGNNSRKGSEFNDINVD